MFFISSVLVLAIDGAELAVVSRSNLDAGASGRFGAAATRAIGGALLFLEFAVLMVPELAAELDGANKGGGASRLTAKGLVLLVATMGAFLVTGDVTVGAEITGKLGLGARATIGFADFTRSERFAG